MNRFRSPYTGEVLEWFNCLVHAGAGLGAPGEAPHHCRAVWSHPDSQRECRWESNEPDCCCVWPVCSEPAGGGGMSDPTGDWIDLYQRVSDDPDQLAVACAAYTLAGYNPQWLRDEARVPQAAIDAALARRNRRVLRNRGEGLLLALEALAADVDEAVLHRVQVENGVIECRVQTIEERTAFLSNPEPLAAEANPSSSSENRWGAK